MHPCFNTFPCLFFHWEISSLSKKYPAGPLWNNGPHVQKNIFNVFQTLLPPPPKVDGGCFHRCLSICLFLFVCEQNISKSCGWIRMEFGREFGYVTKAKWLDFREDPNPYLDPRIFKVIFHHWEIQPKMAYSRISQKVVTDSDETWWAGWVCNKKELEGEHSGECKTSTANTAGSLKWTLYLIH